MTIALWCLLLTALLHVITKAFLIKAQSACEGGYDNNYPRTQQATLEGWGLRALGAHENQIESFPLFAAGVLVATATGQTSAVIGYLAIAFVVCRLIFIACYLKDMASLRSPVWMVGYLISLALMCSPAWA